MTRRARDGGFYCADGCVVGACMEFVCYVARMDASWARAWNSFAMSRSNRIRLEFWGWFMETPLKARSLYTRRLMAPVGVEIV